jgi:hypothetical protein
MPHMVALSRVKDLNFCRIMTINAARCHINIKVAAASFSLQPRQNYPIALTDADELPAAEWVKRMGYADKLRQTGGNVCIPR